MEGNTVVNLAGTNANAIRPDLVIQSSQREDPEVEIDLVKLFYALKDRLLLIILLGLIFANLFALGTRYLITPVYTSTSKMLVLSKETTISSLADLQLGSQLTRDYTILIQSRPVLTEVIENLDLDMDYEGLLRNLSVANPSDSRILEISVKNKDPYLAKSIVDEVATVSSQYIADKMEVTTPNIIEEGDIPYRKTSPSMSRNVIIGMLLGLLLGCAIAVVEELLNDAIVTEEDVEQYLGLYTLALLPDKSQSENTGFKFRKPSKKLKKGRNRKAI